MSFLILESKRDDLLLPYFNMLKQSGINIEFGKFKSMLLNKLSNEGGIRNLSLRSNYYLAGAAKYYLAGELTRNHPVSILSKEFWENNESIGDEWKEDVCLKLNALINVLRNAYIDSVGEKMELPEDFGEISLKDLFRKYSKFIKKELGTRTSKNKKSDEELNRNPVVGNGYTFEIMYSQADCQKYERPTAPGSWCITYGVNHYNMYVKRLGIHYVIFRMDGWENVKRPSDPRNEPGWTQYKPHDLYGNSLIAVLQSNTSPEPVYITSRWNHGYEVHCEADHAYTKEEFEQITGVTDDDLKRIYDIWKTDSKRKTCARTVKTPTNAIRAFKYAQMRINAGESIESIFIVKRLNGNNENLPKITKDIIAVGLEVNGTTYTALMDRGKVVFETISEEPLVTAGEDYIHWLLGPKQNLLYNRKYHRLASVDGVHIFKYIPSISWSNYKMTKGVLTVKQSTNEIALIDSETFLPIQLPNGEYWFNACRSSNNSSDYYKVYTDCFFHTQDDGRMMELTFDLSSGEKYLYDSFKHKFYDFPENKYNFTYPRGYNETYAPNELVPMLVTSSSKSNGYYGIQFIPPILPTRGLHGNIPIVVCKEGHEVEIGGEPYVRDFEGVKGTEDFLLYTPMNENYGYGLFNIYNCRTKQTLSILGQKIKSSPWYTQYIPNCNILMIKRSGGCWYMYNASVNAFYMLKGEDPNDISSYRFEHVTVEDGDIYTYHWDENYNTITTPFEDEAVIVNNQKEKEHMINKNDIQQMVRESINKILKQIINEGKSYYHWDISTTNDEMEALSQVDTSYDEYGDFDGFRTQDAAFRAGLKQLRNEWSEGQYILEVWMDPEWDYGSRRPSPEYVNGYIAVSNNGKITQY